MMHGPSGLLLALVAVAVAAAPTAAAAATTTTTTTVAAADHGEPGRAWAPPATATTTTTVTTRTTPASATISGIIEGKAPLAGVVVELQCGCLSAPLQATTGSDGRYRFHGLPAGKYTIVTTIQGTLATSVATLAPGTEFAADFIIEAPAPPPPAPPAPPSPPSPPAEDRPHAHRHTLWGGLGVGLVFAPLRPAGHFSANAQRIATNQMTPWAGPIRGVDVRWQTFDIDKGRFPRTIGYFRSGYTQGSATFDGPATGEASALRYLTVPLFVGANLYLFRDFPVRPYAGLGFGVDVMRLDFQRQAAGDFRDVSARIGFEFHGGVEVRIGKHISLTAELMQLWSARRRLAALPDVTNQSFTAILGVAGAFPVARH